jgi:hypothetical protein
VRPSATSTDAASPATALAAAVQHNCERADARHAREKSLCTYLLGMREYYRWAAGLPLTAAPRRQDLSAWIAARESRWDALRDAGDMGFAPLPLDEGIDPFDDAEANRRLVAQGLVYGAGIGLFGAPIFFLAHLHAEQVRDGVRILIADLEIARGVVAPPAAARNGTIVVRRDALRRWLWTRTESARRGPAETAFVAALRAYGDSTGPQQRDDPSAAAAAIDRMVAAETETLILHELGELQATAALGAAWEEMLAGIEDRRTELVVRAVRDLCADCLVTLPVLIERQAEPSLLFWLANFDGVRRALAPELAAACRSAPHRIDHDALARAARSGRQTWVEVAGDLLASWRRGGHVPLAARAARLAPAT